MNPGTELVGHILLLLLSIFGLVNFIFIYQIRDWRIKSYKEAYGEDSSDYQRLYNMLCTRRYIPVGRLVTFLLFVAPIYVILYAK